MLFEIQAMPLPAVSFQPIKPNAAQAPLPRPAKNQWHLRSAARMDAVFPGATRNRRSVCPNAREASTGPYRNTNRCLRRCFGWVPRSLWAFLLSGLDIRMRSNPPGIVVRFRCGLLDGKPVLFVPEPVTAERARQLWPGLRPDEKPMVWTQDELIGMIEYETTSKKLVEMYGVENNG